MKFWLFTPNISFNSSKPLLTAALIIFGKMLRKNGCNPYQPSVLAFNRANYDDIYRKTIFFLRIKIYLYLLTILKTSYDSYKLYVEFYN